MQSLSLMHFPLHGSSLIEASAGTGKTYTIVNLYLRLLLGHDCQPLTVAQILVVTFTNAATEELKNRIRQRIHTAYLAFYLGHSDDPFLTELLVACADHDQARRHLALAMREMDDASVFTIHGFCHRMLTQHAFESGSQYDQTLVTDQTPWLQQATHDFWRSHIAVLPTSVLRLLISDLPSPHQLMKDISGLIAKPCRLTPVMDMASAQNKAERYLQALAAAKTWWQAADVYTRLHEAKLRKNVKLGKPATLHLLNEFMCSEQSVLPPLGEKNWQFLAPAKVQAARTKQSSDLSDLDFGRFEALDDAYQDARLSLSLAIRQQAVAEIRANLQRSKQRQHVISPDDLLSALQRGLQQDSQAQLRQAIRRQYPAALIDEFQDTDPVQFDIFQQVFAAPDILWVMIGDPKQAIYGFRGADIFTYIQAKHLISQDRHFTLDTNWRSQQALVKAVNQVFASSPSGFMSGDDIPFLAVNAGKDAAPVQAQDHPIPALTFHLLSDEQQQPIPANQATPHLARHMANQIVAMLSEGKVKDKPIAAGDICVLVRDRLEAGWMRDALAEVNVASVFLARQSVFATQIAQDVYLLLNALANPSSERAVRATLSSTLFGFSAAELDTLFQHELRWQSTLEHFYQWHNSWLKRGIMSAVHEVMVHFDVAANIASSANDGLRRLTDLRHLLELLQEQSAEIPAPSQLLSWMYQHLYDPDHQQDIQQIRLETDANLVQIVTTHASKGLEYPVVFIPFACRFRESADAVFHDDDQQLVADLSRTDTALYKADRERLAEDIRLLYVALTRAIYHCAVGVWDVAHAKRKNTSLLLNTAIGQLLVGDVPEPDAQALRNKLVTLTGQADIAVVDVDTDAIATTWLPPATEDNEPFAVAQLSRPVDRHWQLTSYSAISRQQQREELNRPGYDEGADNTAAPVQAAQGESYNRFMFERGAQAGSFLHGVLENISGQRLARLPEVVSQQGSWFGIAPDWYAVIERWLTEVLHTPLTFGARPFTLAEVPDSDQLAEMEFHLPLRAVQEADFNRLLNHYSQQYRRHYQFGQLNGMLKGFIDVTFCVDGRYYVADYKSNHLGDTFDDYRHDQLTQAMEEHDYHLQGILYVLALHRWLRQRLPDYNYSRHIGGACYLFLRGMHSAHPDCGVYHWCPPQALIEQLDALFDGETPVFSNPDSGQLALW